MDDLISRQSIKRKLQEHHDFLVESNEGWIAPSVITNARIDEISNCIAKIANEPSVQPQTEPPKIKCNSDTIKQLRDMVVDINCEEIFAHDDVTMPMWTSAWRERMFDLIDELPSVNPQPKTGHWTKEETIDGWDRKSYQCSCCGRSIHLDTVMEDLDDYPYCHCGAKMEDGE